MLLPLTLLFPVGLLLLVLAMERVERPLRDEKVGERVVEFLVSAPADDVERLVSRDAAQAVERYWRRRGLAARLRPRRTAARG
jgi:hypothetical protein